MNRLRLTDPQYTLEFNELKEKGGMMSMTRTAAETEAALFWTTNMVIQTQQAYRQEAAKRGLGLLETARLMAMGNMVATDSLIATFDVKYAKNFWRPVTAIQRADTDGNPDTIQDTAWMPLAMTPNFPEFVAGHGSFVSAQAGVYEHFFWPSRSMWTWTAVSPGPRATMPHRQICEPRSSKPGQTGLVCTSAAPACWRSASDSSS